MDLNKFKAGTHVYRKPLVDLKNAGRRLKTAMTNPHPEKPASNEYAGRYLKFDVSGRLPVDNLK